MNQEFVILKNYTKEMIVDLMEIKIMIENRKISSKEKSLEMDSYINKWVKRVKLTKEERKKMGFIV